MVLALARRRSKHVYATVVFAVIVSMLVSPPLLESQQIYAFSQKQATRQAEHEQRIEEQQASQQFTGGRVRRAVGSTRKSVISDQ